MSTPITHIRHVGLAVPDLDAELRFFEQLWGLTPAGGGDDHMFLAADGSAEPFILRLRKAARRQTDMFAFAAEDRAGVDRLFADIAAHGARIVAEPAELRAPGGGYGFRLFDPEGRLIEVASDVAQRVAVPLPPRSARPQGLAHVVFATPQISETVHWYETVLGLRVADWLEDKMCFLRGNTAKHHCLAFLSGPPTLNHVAFEMPTTDDVMRGLGRMLKNDIRLNWGPGRHTAGDNIFAYFRTPAGNTVEYTAEVEHLPDDWVPRILPRSAESIDQWGTGRIAGDFTGTAANWQSEPDPGLWQNDALASTPSGESAA